jgi:hypothetical protein
MRKRLGVESQMSVGEDAARIIESIGRAREEDREEKRAFETNFRKQVKWASGEVRFDQSVVRMRVH